MVKLCINQEAPKHGEDGYNPAYKYDMLWYVLFSNVNATSKHAEFDLCGDETTWGTVALVRLAVVWLEGS
jgi:hypothetical protein